MNKKIYTWIMAIALLFVAGTSQAAFIVKQQPKHAPTETVNNTTTTQATEANADETPATTTAQPTHVKKHSLFSRMWHAMTMPHKAVMPLWAYIILSIIGLGWLAMGINEGFTDLDWLLCLLLYIIFYVPGLIYSLIKIGKFY